MFQTELQLMRMMDVKSVEAAACFIILMSFAGCKKPEGARGTTGKVRSDSAQMLTRIPVADSHKLSIDSLHNPLVQDLEEDWVRLHNGSYSLDTGSAPFDRIYLGIGRFLFADLNGDGYQDALAELSENDGGSAISNSLAVFVNRHGVPVYNAAYYIGDREEYGSIRVRGNTLDVFLKVRGPDDPLCCPTMAVERKLRFQGDTLTEIK